MVHTVTSKPVSVKSKAVTKPSRIREDTPAEDNQDEDDNQNEEEHYGLDGVADRDDEEENVSYLFNSNMLY